MEATGCIACGFVFVRNEVYFVSGIIKERRSDRSPSFYAKHAGIVRVFFLQNKRGAEHLRAHGFIHRSIYHRKRTNRRKGRETT